MIQRIETLGQTLSWQKMLSESFTHIQDLLDFLQLRPADVNTSEEAAKQFKCLIPLSFAQRMEKANPFDPLLLQMLPVSAELQRVEGFVQDPVGDLKANPIPGLLHKYQGRVLLITNGGCAGNCRYCFRRHFPYEENSLSHAQIQQAIHYIQEDESISEVIFSGGEPLLNSDDRLATWIRQLAEIKHVSRIRFHSRLPVFLPARVTTSFIEAINATHLKPIMVVHSNHPMEISKEVQRALLKMHDAGILVLNQSVLLKDINDDAKILAELSERLFAANALPYYLHSLDPVQGAAHFHIDEIQLHGIYRELCNSLPGFLVPKLVKEVAGEKSKIGLNPNFQL
jgi:EF-P beta-lysylation protein EpmB